MMLNAFAVLIVISALIPLILQLSGCFFAVFLSSVGFIYLFIYVWLRWVFFVAARAFSSCGERGLLFVAVCGLLTVVASLVVEHGL